MKEAAAENILVRSIRKHPIGWAVSWFLFTVFPAVLAVWHDLGSSNSLVRALLDAINSLGFARSPIEFSPWYLLWVTGPVGLGMLAYIAHLVRTRGRVEPDPEEPSASGAVGAVREPLGFFDHYERADAASNKVVEAGKKITSATIEFGQKLQTRTAEARELGGTPRMRIQDARPILSNAASDASQYADHIEEAAGPMSTNITIALESWSEMTTIWDEDIQGDIGDIVQARHDAKEFAASLAAARKSVSGLRRSIDSWPRMSKELISAKAKAGSVLKSLESRFAKAEKQARELVAQFDEIVADRTNGHSK